MEIRHGELRETCLDGADVKDYCVSSCELGMDKDKVGMCRSSARLQDRDGYWARGVRVNSTL